jgi:hypothetical protein
MWSAATTFVRSVFVRRCEINDDLISGGTLSEYG